MSKQSRHAKIKREKQIRKIKKSNRALGYPSLDPFNLELALMDYNRAPNATG